MPRDPDRRDVLKTTVKLAAAGALAATPGGIAGAREQAAPATRIQSVLDPILHAASQDGDLPGVVAMIANDSGVVYEGTFGTRRLPAGPAMTRDTVFRVASMVKLITSVAAMRLVEQDRLSLDAPVPDIDPALSAPQVLEGFDATGKPRLRPARRPITLRHLLTHTSGFVYRLWDANALRYSEAVAKLPVAERSKAPHTPLMFDPGERWEYGTSINWVGRLVEEIGGEPLMQQFRRHILDPLGMKDTADAIDSGQRAREASGHRRQPDGTLLAQPVEKPPTGPQPFSGGGGIYSSAPDYLTLIRMLMHGGSLRGVRILRPETVALMGQNQIGDINVRVLRSTSPGVSGDVDFFPGISLKWGIGSMINVQPVPERRSAGSLTWAGLFNTYYWIDPRRRIAGVFMTQLLPFADERVLRVYRAFERGVYATVKAD